MGELEEKSNDCIKEQGELGWILVDAMYSPETHDHYGSVMLTFKMI